MQSVCEDATPLADDRLSPELALVDPQLSASARSRLLDQPWAAWSPSRARHETPVARPVEAAREGHVSWKPERIARGREETPRRLLASVAVATILVLLLLDVRVQVSERPASALSLDVGRDSAQGTAGQSAEQTTGNATPAEAIAPSSSERRFAWAPVPRASGYHVEFFRGALRVLSQDTHRAELTVPARWNYRGVQYSFRPGEYAWYVWPIESGRRTSRALVQTTVSIPNR